MAGNKDFKFDKMAFSYDGSIAGKASQRFYRLLLDQVEVHHGASVLDVGCGTGTILKCLSERVDIIGYGIDAEENMIQEAKNKCPSMRILVCDCTKTPFENGQFDVITVCMAYHHFADQEGFAKEAARIIQPGGSLYIADPHFPVIIRKPFNFILRHLKIAGYFGTPKEIEKVFSIYGFSTRTARWGRCRYRSSV